MKKIVLSGKLGKEKFVLVDDEDFAYLNQWKWYTLKCVRTSYAFRRIWDGKKQHRLYMHNVLANPPKGMLTDHRDSDGLNNQRSNLRICTEAQNHFNRSKKINSKSGYKGVWWNRNRKKWGVEILTNGKRTYLGYFLSAMEAARAYDIAAIEQHGEFAKLNFPRKVTS